MGNPASEPRSSRTVVTGGAGFLGLHLARGLTGRALTLLDIAHLPESDHVQGVSFVRGDVRDRPLLRRVFDGADSVVHAAAGLPLWRKKEILSVNIEGTSSVLDVAHELGIPRVVMISSTAVYGIPNHHPLTEADPLRGVGAYGISKVAAEELVERFRDRGMVIPVLRPKTFVGPERLGVFQILFEWVRQGRRIPVIGDGQNRYQLLDVQDLVGAVELALDGTNAALNATFNVGATRFGTVEADLTKLFEFAGSGSTSLKTPPLLAKSLLGVLSTLRLSPLYRWVYATADQESYVDTSRLQQLGWSPRWSNAEALCRAYSWYLENRQSIGNVGKVHRTPWSEGALAFLRRFM